MSDPAKGWSETVRAVFTSTPAWTRAIVLLLVVCFAGFMITVFGLAILAGREASLWPPHVAAFEAPIVSNRKELSQRTAQSIQTDQDIVLSDQKQIEQYNVARLAVRTADAANNGGFTRGSTVDDLQKDIAQFTADRDVASARIRAVNDQLAAKCVQ